MSLKWIKPHKLDIYKLSILFLILSLLLPTMYCQAQEGNKVITIVDALGRTVEIDKEPVRVVSLAPSITETLFYLDIKHVIVGVDNFSYYDPYMDIDVFVREYNVENVGGYWWTTIDVEKILYLKPDLILADKGAHQPLLKVFEDYGLKVVYLNGGGSRSLNDIYYDFNIIATIFNVQEKVSSFINNVEKEFVEYRNKFLGLNASRVLVVVDVYKGIWVAGKATFIDDILSKLGLVNVAELMGWVNVDIESIMKWSPDIILIASTSVTEESLKGTGLYTLDKPIIFLREDVVNSLVRPGPRIINVPKYLYEAIGNFLTNTSTTIEQPLMEYPVLYRVALFLIPVFIAGFLAGYAVSMRRR